MCKPTKLVLYSFSFSRGGAAIAASKFEEIATTSSTGVSVLTISQDGAGLWQFVKRLIVHSLLKLQYDRNTVKHSLNLCSFKPVLLSFERHQDAVHHINWINNDTLSVFDFDKIPVGSIITLHDEWLYCGTEHYADSSRDNQHFKNRYQFMQAGIFGINWNFLIWRVKRAKLSGRKDLIYTVPSRWMLERARSSTILRHSDLRLLPNAISTSIFKKATAQEIVNYRSELYFLENDFVIVFGAIGGRRNPLKGASLLENALLKLKLMLSDVEVSRIRLVDFGGQFVGESRWKGFRMTSVGHISKPEDLALLYSAAQCVVVPSLVESFGQVAAEASACETPVVCFDTSGLRDVVKDGVTGFHAECFSDESLANKIQKLIKMKPEVAAEMGKRARDYILTNFSYPVVQNKYLEIIRDAEAIKHKYDG